MKKLFLLLIAALILTAPALADTADDLLQAYDSRWDGWFIPEATHAPGMSAVVINEKHGWAMMVLKKGDTNVLCILKKQYDAWQEYDRSTSVIERGDEIPIIGTNADGEFFVSYLGDSGYPELTFTFAWSRNDWRITRMDILKPGYEYDRIEVMADRLIYVDTIGDQKPSVVVEGVFENSFSQFALHYFPMTLSEARASLTLPPMIPVNRSDAFSLPDPVEIAFPIGQQYPVYSAPGEGSFRSANGRALLSTNDWVQVFGEEDGWLLVQYDISADQLRIGYITSDSLPKGVSIRQLHFACEPACITADTYLTDDPLLSAITLMRLRAGQHVTLLATMGSWGYIETSMPDGSTIRGFIPNHTRSLTTYDQSK